MMTQDTDYDYPSDRFAFTSWIPVQDCGRFEATTAAPVSGATTSPLALAATTAAPVSGATTSPLALGATTAAPEFEGTSASTPKPMSPTFTNWRLRVTKTKGGHGSGWPILAIQELEFHAVSASGQMLTPVNPHGDMVDW